MKVWESAVRRAQSLVSPTAVSPSSSESSSGEILLSNGDFYTGQWSPDSGVAQGSGKYLWSDGCMYEGQWSSDGLPDGQGKFSWPSGATYEGQFRSSYMDGFGTYTAPSGATYRGFWSMNRKHGDGTKSFPNGDFYDGQWLRDLPDGRGRYVWANGDEYTGQWRAGVIHGPGSFACAGGERYDGEWDSGRPADERFAVAVGALRVSDPDAASVLPSQKQFDWPRGGSFDGDTENDQGCCVGDRTPTRFRSCAGGNKRRRKKKQGETISKGHKNYELMLNLQLGIRHAVGKQPSQPITLDLKTSAFDPKEKVWTKFPPEGTKHTPPHQSCDFKWKDYCPLVFRTLRNLFKVDAADYMLSICGDDALRELSSPGKSGSFFYLTNDDRYMIKTMKKSEAKVLIRMLPAYYNHVRCFKNTLVTRFFGLHCVKLTGPTQKKVRFVIMGNLFCSEHSIHRRFDLKGSSLGRITDKPESEINETTTLKDLDLNFLFRLQSSWFEEFQWQVERDCEFLEQERIMDYSLLVGVHFRDGHRNVEPSDPNRVPAVRLGVNLASHVERTIRRIGCEGQLIGEPTGEIYDVILFFGIIDILQDYDISKKLEHAYKSFQYDPTSISAVDPIQYAKRFKDFVYKVFIEDT